MAKEYSKEQLWKLFEKLPQELKEAVFSEETSDSIWEVCIKNKIEGNEISEVARYTGRVLLGILPPAEFRETLEKEVKLDKEQAKKVAQEINRFVFYPVKRSLEELYKIEIAPPAKPRVTTEMKALPVKEKKKEKPPPQKKKDVYREVVE